MGIRVVMIQPGGVKSAFGDHAQEAVRLPEDSIYKSVEQGIRDRARAGQQGGTPTDTFIVPVVERLLREPPPAIIRGGRNSVRLPTLKKLLPLKTFDAMLSRAFGLDQFKP